MEIQMMPKTVIEMYREAQIRTYFNYIVDEQGRIYHRSNPGTPLHVKNGAVQLQICNKKKRLKLSKIVASLFIPNIECLPDVENINGDENDNRIENLKWVDIGSINYLPEVIECEAKQRTIETGQIFVKYFGYCIFSDGCIWGKDGRKLAFCFHTLKGPMVHICISGRANALKKQLPVKTLVATFFVTNKSNYRYVKSIDGDVNNVHYKNLEWVSYTRRSINLQRLSDGDTEKYKTLLHEFREIDPGVVFMIKFLNGDRAAILQYFSEYGFYEIITKISFLYTHGDRAFASDCFHDAVERLQLAIVTGRVKPKPNCNQILHSCLWKIIQFQHKGRLRDEVQTISFEAVFNK